jgi:hypothetical protein
MVESAEHFMIGKLKKVAYDSIRKLTIKWLLYLTHNKLAMIRIA